MENLQSTSRVTRRSAWLPCECETSEARGVLSEARPAQRDRLSRTGSGAFFARTSSRTLLTHFCSDNYQGEEANIVIMSLVRSSSGGTIGFLREPERVNVLLSRAKCGEIIFGNRSTLERYPLWKKICGHLERHGQMFESLPAVCQTHGTPANLTEPGDFALYCKHGGCDLPCGKLLGCGHECSQVCHLVCDKKCTLKVTKKCKRGSHDLSTTCGATTLPTCKAKISWECSNGGHSNRVACSVVDAKRKCETCAIIEKLEKKRKKEEDELADKRVEWENAQAVRLKKAEDATRIQTNKKLAFEKKKNAELSVRTEEIEARRLEREQKLREEHAGEDTEEHLRLIQEEADKDVVDLERLFKDQLQLRERQAAETIQKIEDERQADTAAMNKANLEHAQATNEVIQGMEGELRAHRARNNEERRRTQAEQDDRQREMENDFERGQAALREEEEGRKLRADAHEADIRRKRAEVLNKRRIDRVRQQRQEALKNLRREDELIQLEDVDVQKELGEQLRECSICMDEVMLLSGYDCGEHFTCDDCFAMHVGFKFGEELRILEATEGKVYCPGVDCEAKAVTEGDIFLHAGEAGIRGYLGAQKKLLEKKLGEEIRKEERERLEREKVRIAAMDQLQREVHNARTTIVEDLLTLKCPREGCRQAFLDFDGCFALSCSKCGCGFCAWCLEDCGRDAHAHVANCEVGREQNGRDYYGTEDQFVACQKERRQHSVRDFLRTLTDAVRVGVIRQVQPDLKDLGIEELLLEFGGVGEAGAVAEAEAEAEAAVAAVAAAQLEADDEELAMRLQEEMYQDDEYFYE